MNPAPPVTSARLPAPLPAAVPCAISVLLGARALRPTAVVCVMRRGVVGPPPARRALLVERKKVANRVHDAEPATVRGGRPQAHRRLVEELVHERAREVLDGLALGRR